MLGSRITGHNGMNTVRIMQTLLLLTTLWSALLDPMSGAAQGGDRIYLNAVLEETSKGKASYYRELTGREDGHFMARTYAMDGSLKCEGSYADKALRIEDGVFTFYHPNGKVESTGRYMMGLKTGIWLRYDKWGRDLAEKVYDPEPLKDILYTRAEVMPEYPGGEHAMVEYLRGRVQDTDGVRMKGKATASFVVEKDGTVTQVQLDEGMGEPFDERMVDALEGSPKWSPGTDQGRPVRVQMRVPVKF
ncbi:MAG: energy transducer TonB [Flavobacteriales bacterium]|nr:energy transducer TonB [Flavobacteriales bacterium]MCB0816996.1 energy transducer TonB [Flavobacteriales bacterium]